MQISSNYSMNGVPYENRRRQDNIPQFSTERAEQENESINPYMSDVDFDEKAFDMIGPNAPQKVKDAWMETAKEVKKFLFNCIDLTTLKCTDSDTSDEENRQAIAPCQGGFRTSP